MKFKLFYCLLTFFCFHFTFAQIIVDGNIDEWQNQNNIVDANNDGNNIEILELELNNDEQFLFIKLIFEQEINLTEDNNLKLYIDADNNNQTGFVFDNLGAELVWNFVDDEGTVQIENQNYNVSFTDIFFRALPTYSSNVFEICLDKNAIINGENLFTSNLIKVKVEETNGDVIPNLGQNFVYQFNNNTLNYDAISFVKNNENNIRLLSWNTKQDGLLDNVRRAKFKNIIEKVKPNIIAFQEVWDMTLLQASTFINEIFVDEFWYVAKNENDNNIILSQFPIAEHLSILSNKRLQAVKIDLPEIYPKDLVLINVHLKCCGGNSNDDERQFESDAIAKFILDLKNNNANFTIEPETPILIVGDFNFVGSGKQRQTILNGTIENTNDFGYGNFLDWDQTALKDLTPKQTNLPNAITWRNDFSSFSPGRLDFVFYTDAVLNIDKSFVLQTETLSYTDLVNYNFEGNETQIASDHFPIIADLNFDLTTNILEDELIEDFKILENENQIIIKSYKKGNVSFYNLQGKLILRRYKFDEVLIVEKDFFPSNLIFVKFDDKIVK